MLGRLGLQFSGRIDPRHQGEMDEADPLAAEFVAQLADGFEERQALDVADRAADLAKKKILAIEIGFDEFLDRIGDVRDPLHCRAKIFAPPLTPDSGPRDTPRADAPPLPPLAAPIP